MPRGIYERKSKGGAAGPAVKMAAPWIGAQEMVNWALSGVEREIIDVRARLEALTVQARELRKRSTQRGFMRAPKAQNGASGEREYVRGPYKKAKKKRRKLTPAEREKISKRMKARWARARQAMESAG